jgi:hypothetical protein
MEFDRFECHIQDKCHNVTFNNNDNSMYEVILRPGLQEILNKYAQQFLMYVRFLTMPHKMNLWLKSIG